MSFLTAAFLAGLAALAVPLWLHRRESGHPQQRVVSSLLLMRPSEVPEQTRKTVRHRVLLAVRMLLLAVLALAFAQPLLQRAVTDQAAMTVLPRLIAVDTSLSMHADFDAARAIAHDIVDSLPVGGRAAVVGVADEVTVATAMTPDQSLLHSAVDALRPGMGRLAFDGLSGRLGALAGTLADGTVEVDLISDFQLSALPGQFNALIAGAAGPMNLHPVEADPGNWSVERIDVTDEVAVTVRGFGTQARELDVVLENAEGEIGRRTVAVPAGGRVSARFPQVEAATGERWLRAVIDAGDVLAADDTYFHVLRQSEDVPMPLLASPGAAAQVDYLTAAVAAAAPRFRLQAAEQPGPVAVLVDPGEVTADRIRLLERHLDNGGAVLMAVGPATGRAGRLALTGDLLERARHPDEPRGVVAVDRRHPVLASFGAWREVTVSQHLVAAGSPPGNLLLALDDGSPLLVERRLAAGRLLVLMTALDPSWSTLVTTPAFVAFVADVLGYLAEDALPAVAVAGQRLTIPAAGVQLFDQRDRRMLALGDTVAGASVPLGEPGIYTLRTPSRERLLAVNPDLRESDLAPADPVLLERWQTASRAVTVAPAAPAADDSPAPALPLAPWLLVLLGLLAVMEPVFANTAGTWRAGAVP